MHVDSSTQHELLFGHHSLALVAAEAADERGRCRVYNNAVGVSVSGVLVAGHGKRSVRRAKE